MRDLLGLEKANSFEIAFFVSRIFTFLLYHSLFTIGSHFELSVRQQNTEDGDVYDVKKNFNALFETQIVDMEEGILQLKDDLIEERAAARREKERLKREIVCSFSLIFISL